MGIIESEQDKSTETKAVEKMREYAGELGCDALVIPPGNDAKEVNGASSRTPQAARGYCLVYTAPPLMQPPPMAATNNAPNACIPSSPQPCYGPGGCRGTQFCSGDGKAFTPCDCASSGSP